MPSSTDAPPELAHTGGFNEALFATGLLALIGGGLIHTARKTRRGEH